MHALPCLVASCLAWPRHASALIARACHESLPCHGPPGRSGPSSARLRLAAPISAPPSPAGPRLAPPGPVLHAMPCLAPPDLTLPDHAPPRIPCHALSSHASPLPASP